MSQEMMNLVRQHVECDDQLNRVEAALHKADHASALRNFQLFNEFLESHFVLEEARLFPALEKATGMVNGPTEVMRQEHRQIRALRDELRLGVESRSIDSALAVIDTLNVLIQQHNIKEENVLYPMCGASIPQLSTVLGAGSVASGSTCCGACSCS
jgi:hemerythrin-like domain-containing protein